MIAGAGFQAGLSKRLYQSIQVILNYVGCKDRFRLQLTLSPARRTNGQEKSVDIAAPHHGLSDCLTFNMASKFRSMAAEMSSMGK
jgi:hypothetical protein